MASTAPSRVVLNALDIHSAALYYILAKVLMLPLHWAPSKYQSCRLYIAIGMMQEW